MLTKEQLTPKNLVTLFKELTLKEPRLKLLIAALMLIRRPVRRLYGTVNLLRANQEILMIPDFSIYFAPNDVLLIHEVELPFFQLPCIIVNIRMLIALRPKRLGTAG